MGGGGGGGGGGGAHILTTFSILGGNIKVDRQSLITMTNVDSDILYIHNYICKCFDEINAFPFH